MVLLHTIQHETQKVPCVPVIFNHQNAYSVQPTPGISHVSSSRRQSFMYGGAHLQPYSQSKSWIHPNGRNISGFFRALRKLSRIGGRFSLSHVLFIPHWGSTAPPLRWSNQCR